MSIEATNTHESETGLAGAVDRILDKGLVINADVTIDVAGTELLGIKVRAALASFETAAEYGLEFPAGTEETKAYAEARARNETCPQCAKRVEKEVLLDDECPWCGWRSARSKRRETEDEQLTERDDRPTESIEAERPPTGVDGADR
ncbi:gas vesicle protein [Natrinema soli]|uniref:Gas vesicle protein n=1 Tax=Natrinema soli TaxID=1930624 RepID=A0ABD5SP68_9EURY|nr:gas vesicle protein [Natrinema soli]